MISKIKARLAAVVAWVAARPALSRPLHTFWQAFSSALVVAWAASGIDISTAFTSLAAAQKVLVALAVAAGGAALSALRLTVGPTIWQLAKGLLSRT